MVYSVLHAGHPVQAIQVNFSWSVDVSWMWEWDLEPKSYYMATAPTQIALSILPWVFAWGMILNVRANISKSL